MKTAIGDASHGRQTGEPRSLADLLRRSCSRWRDKAAMLLPGKDGCEAISYTQVWGLVGRYAAVLSEEGLRAGDRVCIFAEGSHEWALADWAARTLGVVVAPIYPTLPADQAQYIVQDCGAKLAIAGSAELAAKLSGVPILLLRGPGSLVERAEAVVVDEKAWNSSIEAIEPGDVSTIIYTSGTTGLPKGAMLSNRACGWVCGAILNNIPLSEADTFFSFLPMAHVFERIDGQILPLSLGATVGYCRSLMSMAGDLQKVRPTVILCVPRVLEALQEKVLDGVRKSPPMRRRLFALALAQGARRFYGKAAPLFWLTDRLVGRKVRTGLGGRLRLLVAGGAALPASVAEFYGAFRLTILQGYGLTETSSGVAVNHPDRNKFWTVGEVLPGMECEIAPDGEILFRGPACMEGYYNLPEETAAAIDDQGWFHTGDIGEFEGKHLKITDRKKDLLVLSNGKNVAPQPIENKLRALPHVQEAVVLGDGMEFCCALIVPAFDGVRAALGLPPGARLSESAEARALIKREIDGVNKTLASFELVKKFMLLDAMFTIESGELTPTLKVKRKVVRERYASLIEGMRG